MVNAALRAFAPEERPDRRACLAADGRRYQDTGQTPCRRAPYFVTRLVAYRPDSSGACIWIEHLLPTGVRFFDGGPFAVPVTRDGVVRREAFVREDCVRQPSNER